MSTFPRAIARQSAALGSVSEHAICNREDRRNTHTPQNAKVAENLLYKYLFKCVLTPSSQVPSSHPTFCEIQREANKKK